MWGAGGQDQGALRQFHQTFQKAPTLSGRARKGTIVPPAQGKVTSIKARLPRQRPLPKLQQPTTREETEGRGRKADKDEYGER